MKIKCYKCNHPWDYKGKSQHYVCCPSCYSKISLNKILKLQKKNYILPTKKLHTTEEKPFIDFVEIEEGILVEEKLVKQFKEIKETPRSSADVEEESSIRILPPKFEIIRVIPRDPIKILEHQRSFF